MHVSAPRAVENFLDLGHFPDVHAGILGRVPRTDVADCRVEVDPETNELWALDCEFCQPQAAAVSTDGQMSQYTYRVPHPYCVMLDKSCPTGESGSDVVLSEEGAISGEDYPALRRWTERVQRLPGFIDMPGVLPVAPLPP